MTEKRLSPREFFIARSKGLAEKGPNLSLETAGKALIVAGIGILVLSKVLNGEKKTDA